MLLLIITTIVLILSGLAFYKYNSDWFASDFYAIGIPLGVISLVALIFEVATILAKPIDYKNFKIEYDTIKSQITSKDDIRDASFTQNIIEINKQILYCREYKDSIWFGIYQNEKICDTELLKKE